MTPKVSVLMPVYNAEKYVADAIESILRQTMTDFELVIVNDGSTDGSETILNRYAKRDGRIRLISRPNTGLVGALNDGFQSCRGEFVARMDADDISIDKRFAEQVSYLSRNEKCIAVGSQRWLIGPDGAELNIPGSIACTHEEIEAAHLAGHVAIAHPTAMIRTHALTQVGAYRPWPIGEDYDLWLRLGELGELANLPLVLLKYRLTATSYTATRDDSDTKLAILAEAFARRGIETALPTIPKVKQKSTGHFFRSCARRALKSGKHQLARKNAMRAISHEFFAIDSWKLLVNVLLDPIVARNNSLGPRSKD